MGRVKWLPQQNAVYWQSCLHNKLNFIFKTCQKHIKSDKRTPKNPKSPKLVLNKSRACQGRKISTSFYIDRSITFWYTRCSADLQARAYIFRVRWKAWRWVTLIHTNLSILNEFCFNVNLFSESRFFGIF